VSAEETERRWTDVAPEAHTALHEAARAAEAALDPELLQIARDAVDEGVLGRPAGPLPAGRRARAAAALAEQVVLYVPGVGDDLRGPARARLGADGLRTFLEALYALEQRARLAVAHRRLFGAPRAPDTPEARGGPAPPLGRALRTLHAAAMRLSALDPFTTEVVRLRAGSYHDCKT
jgi:hypothetical protein